ncbi:MAG: hypothetical protein IPM54_42205 [Polyangiaceae bacterium]|nr:hypothetical protein [Polyangiaceae bacterium]
MSNPVDIEACYNAHLPAAQALPTTSVLTVRLDPDLAIVNIDTAMHVQCHCALFSPHRLGRTRAGIGFATRGEEKE